MERDEADELGELLRYPEDTAGGMMTTEFVAVPADADGQPRRSTGCASSSPTRRPSTTSTWSTPTSGWSASCRCATSSSPGRTAPVGEVMIAEPVAVDVAGGPRRGGRASSPATTCWPCPVVDDERRLVGIVTVDDAIDTILPAGWRRRLPRPARAASAAARPDAPVAAVACAARDRPRCAIGSRAGVACACAAGSAAVAGSLAFLAVMGPGLIAGHRRQRRGRHHHLQRAWAPRRA